MVTQTRVTGYSEDELIEQPAIALFAQLGWETGNLLHETFAKGGGSHGRETKAEAFLLPRLRAALQRLNPDLVADALDQAVSDLTRSRATLSLAAANQEVYRLLRDGVKVTVTKPDGAKATETVRVIDWQTPANNDFFLASQLWIAGDLYTRRADLVGFVNGLPLLFVELKAAHRRLEDAFKQNLRDYKTTVPHLFWPNALILLSNGSDTLVGSVTAAWEHFSEWKKVASEHEPGQISLETAIHGTCRPDRLLDIVENFMLFDDGKGPLAKVMARNHQYLGVNNAMDAVRHLQQNRGRLGVFWHTQGSGKSVSMIFLSQKILRTLPGNWTFVVVTDRGELDEQIYKNFAHAGAVTETGCQATSADDLRRLLREDHRYVFTLIQKFRTPPGERHPVLSERSNVIVMTDEAHRSQYDLFALNMRQALPHAAFIGFTGTPLMKKGEERTKEVFGDYVSVYDFKQSIEDRATVPLYYENRIPELQLTNEHLNEDMQDLLEDAALDDEQEKKLEREFGREYHLITRDDRLEAIAEDLVAHFMGRGYRGKAMVICIDKATAVRMHDKVRKHWDAYRETRERELAALEATPLYGRRAPSRASRAETAAGQDPAVRAAQIVSLREQVVYMRRLDMAVVVSQSQNEVEEMRAKGLDITPHRRRMVHEDLDEKFKKPDDPFALVFVCAMWMTGFDVPSCSTIYLDKPMRNHTLMQTIARANRVAPGKVSGLIVDYAGVFRNLQQALAIYAAGTPGSQQPVLSGPEGSGASPVEDKTVLVDALERAIGEADSFCAGRGIDLFAIRAAAGFARVKLLDEAVAALRGAADPVVDDAVDALLVSDDTRRRFLAHTSHCTRLFKAILPDPLAERCRAPCVLLGVIAEKIRSLTPPPDISQMMSSVDDLLDESVAARGYVINRHRRAIASDGMEPDSPEEELVDLSRIDFEKLRQLFETGRKRTEAERLRTLVEVKLRRLVRLNKMRLDYLGKFQDMIDEYNAGSVNIEEFFQRLLDFAQALGVEEQRHIAEHLTEEELALFDLLTKPDPVLTRRDEAAVKRVAGELLATLKREKLVLDWRTRLQTRAAVRETIAELLDQLPEPYTKEVYDRKCDLTYQHIYESYPGEGRSVFEIV